MFGLRLQAGHDYNSHYKMTHLKRVLIIGFTILFWSTLGIPQQREPDPKRKQQIRTALSAHGYNPGRNWSDTISVLKQIAHDHNWQSKHAPDARVLILIGLGNPMSDPDVLSLPKNHLDP
jgi:hypothetical protein